MKNINAVKLAPALYLVATPIGNLRDISLRALDVLNEADFICCEDTRVTGKLLKLMEISDKKLKIYNDHSNDHDRSEILSLIASGKTVALVSDAGMPLISDPGYKLVKDAYDLGLNVTSVPGANAPLAAMQLSGLPSNSFSFLGFLPPKTMQRKKILQDWKNVKSTLLVFEASSRLKSTLEDMLDVLGDRQACVVREITKMFEQVKKGTLKELLEFYHAEGAPKGEIVIVVDLPEEKKISEEELSHLILDALKQKSLKDSVKEIAENTGLSKKHVYELALKLNEKN
jgi:16S rRNA (cytidine1402-2'-O)-methyltransferase